MAEINLPMPYYLEDKEVFLFVDDNGHIRGEKNNTNYFNNLVEPLENLTFASLYYPYDIKDGYVINNKDFEKHCHSFEDVVRTLYDHPESFKINDKQKLYYSIQELDYLNRTQKLLLFYGLTDMKNFKDKTRYTNSKCKKYADAKKWRLSNDDLDKIINNNYIFKISSLKREEEFKPNEYTALLLDEEYNVKVYIEFIDIKKVLFKEIKDRCLDKEYNDEDEVYIYNYHILEKF